MESRPLQAKTALLGTRRFGPLFFTQFLGAFNDNLFKNALVILLTFQAASWTSLSPGLLANLAAGLFILPFFLFSALAGQLADKYDKARLARLSKLGEIFIMALAGAGFWLSSLPLLLTALFLMGLQSTFFGPIKYALLPQHLREAELVSGNAWVEAGTFVAILVGTLAGGLLAGLGQAVAWIPLFALIVAGLGYLSSLAIPEAPAPAPELRLNFNPLTETWRNLADARKLPVLFFAIVAISWFWLYGAMFLTQFPAYAKTVLGGGETTVTALLAVFTLGIGLGSFLCERWSGPRIEIGLVPIGALGLSLFGLDLALASPTDLPGNSAHDLFALLSLPVIWRIFFDLLMIGLFGGLFIVPLYTLIQRNSPPGHCARIIAANNILNALFMVVGALLTAVLLGLGVRIPELFAGAAVLNGLFMLFIHDRVPDFMKRCLALCRGEKAAE